MIAEERVEVLDAIEQGVGATCVAAGENCVAAKEQRVENLMGFRAQRQPAMTKARHTARQPFATAAASWMASPARTKRCETWA